MKYSGIVELGTKQEASTKKVYAGVEKRRFKYRNYIKSSKVMLAIDNKRT